LICGLKSGIKSRKRFFEEGMNQEVRFRRSCEECGRIFFSAQRDGKICPRCIKQVAEREEQKKKAREKAALKRKDSSKSSMQDPVLPPTLTEELKNRILREYEPLRERRDFPRRKIHGLLAQQLRIPKRLVAQALPKTEEGRTPLSPEQEEEIIRRYQRYVERLERPTKGRRKTIAADMGLPYRSVATAVREWKRRQPPLKEVTREQRFFMEKAFFRLVEEGSSLAQIRENLVKDSGYSTWQVLRYLDLLHDGEKMLRKVPEVTQEQSEAILAGYQQYLSAPSPPEPFLHTLLAQRTGVTHQQVHKVLLTYRLQRLGEIQGGDRS
jgi:uncharacterized Zn finger protein (UPF0148 family)